MVHSVVHLSEEDWKSCSSHAHASSPLQLTKKDFASASLQEEDGSSGFLLMLWIQALTCFTSSSGSILCVICQALIRGSTRFLEQIIWTHLVKSILTLCTAAGPIFGGFLFRDVCRCKREVHMSSKTLSL